MKKVVNIIITIIMICGFIILPHCYVRAESETSVSGIVNGIRPTNPGESEYSGLTSMVGKILGFLQIASAITTVIMVVFLGFKSITELPDIKQEIKHRMFPMIIGIVLVFGAASIAKFIIGVTG